MLVFGLYVRFLGSSFMMWAFDCIVRGRRGSFEYFVFFTVRG